MKAAKKSNPTNPVELLDKIRKVFPDITWTKYQYLDEGWDHEVIILDDKLVFRFPNDSEYLKLLKTEIEALHTLQPLVSSVHIPNYSYVASHYLFAGYKFLKGHTLTRRYFDTLSVVDHDVIARKLAGFFTAMHAAIQEGHTFRDMPTSDMIETQAEDKVLSEKHLKLVLSEDDYRLVEAILDETDTILSQDLPSVLLHGDVYSTHLLWNDETNELGIIDFSDMNLGDPAFDFAELYEYGEEFVQQIYQYYTGPKDDTFLDRSKIYQKWVGIFMMVDFFIHHKTSFEKARETFDRTKHL